MRLERPELPVLEFGKTAAFDSVFPIVPTNMSQSAPNLLKMYVAIGSWISMIMDLNG